MLQQSMSQHILKVYEFLLVLTQGFRARSKLFQRLVFVYLELAPSQFLLSRTGTIIVVVDNNVLFIISHCHGHRSSHFLVLARPL